MSEDDCKYSCIEPRQQKYISSPGEGGTCLMIYTPSPPADNSQHLTIMTVTSSEEDSSAEDVDSDVTLRSHDVDIRRPNFEDICNCHMMVSFLTVLGAASIHGYNTGVLNLPEDAIMKWIQDKKNLTVVDKVENETNLLIQRIWAWIVSIFSLGGMVGGLLVAFIVSNCGETRGLMMSGVLAVFGSLLEYLAVTVDSLGFLLSGRFVIGICSGLDSGMASMFLSEIAPTGARGSFGALYRTTQSLAILLSQILGMRNVLGNTEHWPLLLGFTMIPALMMVFILPWLPNTPSFLYIAKDEEEKARNALEYYRPKSVSTAMKNLQRHKLLPNFHLSDFVHKRQLRQPLVISLILMMTHQVTGMKVIIYFSKTILASVGVATDDNAAEKLTLIVGVANLIGTIIATFIVDRMGRKTLLITGLSGMIISFTTIYIILHQAPSSHFPYVSITLIVIFVAFYGLGPGPIPWFLVSELFPLNVKSMAVSVSVGFNFLCGFAMAWLYPFIKTLEKDVFLLFVVIQFSLMTILLILLPETKNKSIYQIIQKFQ